MSVGKKSPRELGGLMTAVSSVIAITLLLVPMQTIKGKPAPAGAWGLLKRTDAMTDKETRSLISWAPGKKQSLRVTCNDSGGYVVLLTLPKALDVGSMGIT